MTFGSLFAGIGGMDLGLEWAGMECRWQVEVDPYARGILEKHWPGIRRWGDIRLLDPDWCEPVDLVCGGFPCQPVSVAGKRKGQADKRWLWPEMLRIVRHVRPGWVLAENVGGLRTAGADTVLGDLEAEGYACWPLVVGAWAVGAAHERSRIWIVAHTDQYGHESLRGRGVSENGDASRRDHPDGCRVTPFTDANVPGLSQRGETHGHAASSERRDTAERSRDPGEEPDTVREQLWQQPRRRCGACGSESPFAGSVYGQQHTWEASRAVVPVGRGVHGLSRRLALKALGNAVVPQVVEVIGRAIIGQA